MCERLFRGGGVKERQIKVHMPPLPPDTSPLSHPLLTHHSSTPLPPCSPTHSSPLITHQVRVDHQGQCLHFGEAGLEGDATMRQQLQVRKGLE